MRADEEFSWANPPDVKQAGKLDEFSSDGLPKKRKQSVLVKALKGFAAGLALVTAGVLAGTLIFGGVKSSTIEEPQPPEQHVVEIGPDDKVVASSTLDGKKFSVIESDCAMANSCKYEFKSSDLAEPVAIAEGRTFYGFQMFDQQSGVVGFAPDDGPQIMLTNDGGATWHRLDLQIPDDWPVEATFLQSAQTSGTPSRPIYEFTLNYPSWEDRGDKGLTFRSRNLGQSWELVGRP